MKFESSDAWLLQSIRHSEKDGVGASLVDIIAFADYSNHAIMTYAEFSNGVKRLIGIGLVIEFNKKLVTTDLLRTWWTKKFEGKRKISIQKGLKEIEMYLNKNVGAGAVSKAETMVTVTEQDFKTATDDYLKK